MMRTGSRTGDQLIEAQIAVIDALYGAAADASRRVEVVNAVSKWIAVGPSSIIHRTGHPLAVQRLLATNLDSEAAQAYDAHYGQINPWALRTRGERPPIQINDGWIPAKELESSEFYADWARPLGLRYCLNICVRLAPDETVEIASLRPRRLGAFEETETRLIESLLPHLQRAMEISRRLDLVRASQTAALTVARGLGTGTVLVDANRRIIFSDAAAERILGSGGGIRIRFGRLQSIPAVEAQLSKAIADATGNGKTIAGRRGTLLSVPRPDGSSPLSIAVAPVDERDRPDGFFGPLAMVLVSAPEQIGPLDAEALRTLFDLTPAEARLATALCRGDTLASYADASGASLNTVKTHLKNLFAKTGETRQADLVRRITADLALRLGSDRGTG